MTDDRADTHKTEELDPAKAEADLPVNDPMPSPDDPGGAHAKGYSADPRAEKAVAQAGPIPLSSVPEGESHVRQPEREGKVRPTGRDEGGEYTPNDRLMGSDR
jgi:hypothetical protein